MAHGLRGVLRQITGYGLLCQQTRGRYLTTLSKQRFAPNVPHRSLQGIQQNCRNDGSSSAMERERAKDLWKASLDLNT